MVIVKLRGNIEFKKSLMLFLTPRWHTKERINAFKSAIHLPMRKKEDKIGKCISLERFLQFE